MKNIFVTLEAGEIKEQVVITKVASLSDVDSITRKIYMYLGYIVRKSDKPIDYLDSCNKIAVKVEYDGRLMSDYVDSTSELWAMIKDMADMIVDTSNE